MNELKGERMPLRVAASMGGYLLMVVAILWQYFVHALFSRAPIVIGVQVAAAVLMIWARVTFGMRSFHPGANTTRGALITTGPYHFMRHPIYAAVIFFAFAGMVSQPSIPGLLAFAALVGGVGVRVSMEERFLMQTYPEYAAYAARTKRIIPHVL